MLGFVSDIISFSLADGPGIRTTVFFKGCPLRCAWCHNPETQRQRPQAMYQAYLCVHCGRCSIACPQGCRDVDGSWVAGSDTCIGCGACAQVCPTGTNTLNGQAMTPEQVCERVLRDKPFFRKRGGVTFSGGEPLMQPHFLLTCAQHLHEAGISTAIDTRCFPPWETMSALLPWMDLFLCGWKVTDPAAHRQLTGVDHALIAENLARLSDAGAHIILRCPIIPGCNDAQGHFDGIARLADKLAGIERVELLPYHATGNDKRRRLGLPADGFRVPEDTEKEAWLSYLHSVCKTPVELSK